MRAARAIVTIAILSLVTACNQGPAAPASHAQPPEAAPLDGPRLSGPPAFSQDPISDPTGSIPTASAAKPVGLLINVPASAVAAGAAWPAITVTSVDAGGKAVSTKGATWISIAVTKGDKQLSGTTVRKAEGGVAVFDDLSSTVAEKVTFRISATGAFATDVYGLSIRVIAGEATSLELSLPPSSVAGGEVTAVVIAKDAWGNLATGYPGVLVFDAGGAQAQLPEPYAMTAQDYGVATFPNVSVHTAGVWDLTVSDIARGLSGSSSIAVAPGPAATLAFTAQPKLGISYQVLSPAPAVVAVDDCGNVVPIDAPITATLEGGVLGGVVQSSLIGGVASFPNLIVTEPGEALVLTISTPGVGDATSTPFDVLVDAFTAAEELTFPTQKPTGVVMHRTGHRASTRVAGFAGSIDAPGSLATDDECRLYIGNDSAALPMQPVLRIDAQNTIAVSSSLPAPVSVAVDSEGAVYAAGGATIRGPMMSLDGEGADAVWATVDGAQLTELTIDSTLGVFYAVDLAAEGGQVIEIDADDLSTRVLMTPGDAVSLAIHPDTRDLYVVGQTSGELWVIDTGTGDGNTATWIESWGTNKVNGISFATVGTRLMLYAATTFEDESGISRWDPVVGAGTLELYATGFVASDIVQGSCLSADNGVYATSADRVLELSCPGLGEGARPSMSTETPGWTIQSYAELGGGTPTAIAVDGASGDLILGAGLGGNGALPVRRLTTTGTVFSTASIPDPDGIAMDSEGRVYVGGSGTIWRAASVDSLGSGDEWTAWASVNGNIDDLVVDRLHDNRVYVGLGDGRVVRIDQSGAQIVMMGVAVGGARISVDGAGNLWTLRDDSSGSLWRVDFATGDTTLAAQLSQLADGYSGSSRLVWSPYDGMLYTTTSWEAPARAGVSRWNPASPDTFEEVVRLSNPTHPAHVPGVDANAPADLEWSPTAPCLFVSSPETAKVHRICICG